MACLMKGGKPQVGLGDTGQHLSLFCIPDPFWFGKASEREIQFEARRTESEYEAGVKSTVTATSNALPYAGWQGTAEKSVPPSTLASEAFCVCQV